MAILNPTNVFAPGRKPPKSEIIQLFEQIMGSASAPAVVRKTKVALDLVTPASESYGGIVLDDFDPSKNGYYYRSGAAWLWGRGFPDTAAALTNVGAVDSTITASTLSGVSPANILLVLLPAAPFTNSDQDVSLAINGGNSVPVKNASGGSLAPGDLLAGVPALLFWIEDEWRQLFPAGTDVQFDHQGDYNGASTYTKRQVVTGSNGNWYQVLAASVTGDNPVGSATGNWLRILSASALADGAVTFAKLSASLLATTADAQNIAAPPVGKLMDAEKSYQQYAVLSDYVDIRRFGNAANFASAVDLSSAVQAFLNANPNGPKIRLPRTAPGTGFKLTRLNLPQGAVIEGAGGDQTKIWHAGNDFLLVTQYSYTRIKGVQVDATNAGSSSRTMLMTTDVRGIERCKYEDIVSYKSYGFCQDVVTPTYLAVANEFKDISVRQHRGFGFDLRDQYAYLKLENIVVDFIAGGNPNFPGFVLVNNQGSKLMKCGVTGGTVDGNNVNNRAFVFSNSLAVWLYGCEADTVDGIGFHVEGACAGMRFIDCSAGLGGRHQVLIEPSGGSCTDIVFNNFSSYGRKNLAYKPANANGIYVKGAVGFQMIGGVSKEHTAHGVELDGCNSSNIGGAKLFDNTGQGLKTTNSFGGLLAHGVSFSGNTAGNADFAGPAHHLVASQGSSGALVSLSGVGTV